MVGEGGEARPRKIRRDGSGEDRGAGYAIRTPVVTQEEEKRARERRGLSRLSPAGAGYAAAASILQ